MQSGLSIQELKHVYKISESTVSCQLKKDRENELGLGLLK